MAGAEGYKLPAWYDGARVQLHTRLSLNWHDRHPDTFFGANDAFASMGARVFTRHIKSANEGA